MTDYTYDPETLDPLLAGLAAGAIGALFGAAVGAPLRSPDEQLLNSMTITVTALLIGLATGSLWRRLRATNRAMMSYGIAVAGSWLVAMLAITIVDQVAVEDLLPYAGAIAAVVFLSVGLLTPPFSRLHLPAWTVAVPVLIALGVGLGLLAA